MFKAEKFKNSLIHKLHKLVFKFDKDVSKSLQSKIGLKYTSFMVLMAIVKCGNCNQKYIADYLDLTEAAVSTQIDQLEKEGFLHKKMDPNHRSQRVLTVTEEGEQKLDQALEVIKPMAHSIFGILDSEEERQMCLMLDKLIAKAESPEINPN